MCKPGRAHFEHLRHAISSGGITTLEAAAREPVRTVLFRAGRRRIGAAASAPRQWL